MGMDNIIKNTESKKRRQVQLSFHMQWKKKMSW